MIRSQADVPAGFTERVDVCVVGSGAGGGVAAAVFARAGRTVLVLEEGAFVRGAEMSQREDEMQPRLYRDSGEQYTEDGGVCVLQGRAVGGSTVVNAADVVRTPGPVLEHWARSFGVDRWSLAELDAAAELCEATIGASAITPEAVNRNGQLLLAGGAAVGIAGGAFRHNRVGCMGSGYCLIGCAYDAKRSVALTWIPQALATGGCVLQTEAKAERVEVSGGRAVAVVGHLQDPRTGARGAPFRVEAGQVVLAAGAIHSPLLLQASGLGGAAVGQNLSLQPQAPVSARFREEVVAFRGIPQAAFLDGREQISAEAGLGGFRLESISSGPAMVAVCSNRWGAELGRSMASFRHMAALLALVPDRPGGSVSAARDGRALIRYALQDEWRRELRAALRAAAEVYRAAGAEEVWVSVTGLPPLRAGDSLSVLDALPLRAGDLPLLSAHPQGTCRMGPDPATSVVDPELRLHGTPNLLVLDASVFPTSASSHTMIPVMSFAWLGAHAALGAGG